MLVIMDFCVLLVARLTEFLIKMYPLLCSNVFKTTLVKPPHFILERLDKVIYKVEHLVAVVNLIWTIL